jgi:hypothetical protein
MRLSDHEVEREIGQTPCLCGDFETWHTRCYAGKCDAQIAKELRSAMLLARKELKRRRVAEAMAAIERTRQ